MSDNFIFSSEEDQGGGYGDVEDRTGEEAVSWTPLYREMPTFERNCHS